MLRANLRRLTEERRRTSGSDDAQNHAYNVSRLMFVSATSPIALCIYSFAFKICFIRYYNAFLLARTAAN